MWWIDDVCEGGIINCDCICYFQWILAIRYSVGGYHTCLSRRKPGFESRYRNVFSFTPPFFHALSFWPFIQNNIIHMHATLYTTNHPPYTIKHVTSMLFNKISCTLGYWIFKHSSTATSCTMGHQTLIFTIATFNKCYYFVLMFST